MDSWDILPLIPYTANTVMWTSLIIIKFRVMKECSDQLSPCISYITRTVCSHILSVPRKLPKYDSHLECLAVQLEKHNPSCLRQILWHKYHLYFASKTQSICTAIHKFAAAVTGKEPSGNMSHCLTRQALGHSLPQAFITYQDKEASEITNTCEAPVMDSSLDHWQPYTMSPAHLFPPSQDLCKHWWP